ncbi:MAG TPA: translocation/assembly module TamB domain-containing protein [Negativicutes bacterium]|nr:translocation/assembly module TamB domain-containing protein [Negativicutes bacterium]
MTRGAKLITVLLSFFVILLVAVPAYWYKAVTTSAGLEKALAAQLSEQLGRQVSVGAVYVKPTGKIIAENVAVEDQGQLLLRAEKMTVAYNVLYIFSRTPLSGLRSLEFSRPEIFVTRSEAGDWNIIRFVKDFKRPGQAGGFQAVIRVVDGRVTVTENQHSAVIDAVNGDLDFTHSPELALQISGALAGQPLTVQGSIHTDNGTFGLQLDAVNQSADLLASWWPQPDLAGVQGNADISLFLLQEQYQPLQYSGEIDLKDMHAVLRQNNYQLANVTGKLHVNNKALFLQGITGKVNGEMLQLQGNVALDGRNPYLDLRVFAADINIQKALPDKTIPVEGTARGELAVTGNLDDLRVQGVVGMKQGVVNGIALQDGSAALTYYDGWLEMHNLRAGVWGGTVQGQGVVKLGAVPVYSALLQLDGVQSPRSELTGAITASVFITGDAQNPLSTVWGAGQINNGAAYSIPFDRAETGFYWVNNGLQLDYFNMAMGPGWLLLKGSADRDTLHLTLQGDNIPLDHLAAAFGNIDISGTGTVKGNIEGRMDNPVVNGTFAARQGQVLQQSFAECAGEFSFMNGTLTLRNVTAGNGKTSHSINGSVYLSGEPALDLHIVSRQAPAQELMKLLRSEEKIQGLIDNEIFVHGPLKAPAWEGHLLLTQGLYRGQRIDQAQVYYSYRQGILELKNCTVNSGTAVLELAGTVGAGDELDFRFAARELRFEELGVLKGLPYGISGRAELAGTIQGVWQNPRVVSRINAYDTVINQQHFGNLTGQIEVVNKDLLVPELKLTDGTAVYAFTGKIDLHDAPQIEGRLSVTEGQLPQLLGLLAYPIPDAQGKVSAELTLSGSLEKPDAQGRLTVTQGHVKGYPVDLIELDAVAQQGLVTVNSFELRQGQGFMRARGTWAADDVLALEVGGSNLDAGFVAALLPEPQPVKGTIDFTAQVAGTTQHPQAAVSIEIKTGSWANAEFDSLYALAVLENDIIKLNQIMLIKGPYKASAYGKVPLAALTKKGREEPNSAAGMDIRLQLEQADLSILPLLSQDVAWAVGQTHGQVHIGGNLYQPLIDGKFTITDGTVKFRALNKPVEHVNVDLQFAGDQIRLLTFNGQMGGGSYTGGGSAALNGFSLTDLHLTLNLDKLYVNSKYYVGPLEGAFTLENGARGIPVLKGGLNIANTEIIPPLFWPETNNALPNVRLDVEIQVDKNVRLRSPGIYDMYVKGKVKAQGSLLHPITSGKLTVVRGSLQYLGTSFKITEGAADFTQYDSFLPSVQLTAETRTLDTKIHLQVTGPLSQMNFSLTSEPALSQQQIITLLTLRSRGDGGSSGGNQLATLLNEGLQFTFVQRAEKVFENFLGLDEFHIVRSQNEKVTDREMYNLEVGKFISDKMFIGYTMGIDQEERIFSFRYDITSRFSLDGQWDDKRDRRIGASARFYF